MRRSSVRSVAGLVVGLLAAPALPPGAAAAADAPVEILGVRLQPTPTGVDLEIEASGPPRWATRDRSGGVLEILLADSRPADSLADLEPGDGLVASVRIDTPHPGVTRISIATRKPVSNSIISSPDLLTVRLRSDAPSEPSSGSRWIVSAAPCLNLRAEPRPAGVIVDCLVDASEVSQLGSTPGWKHVRSHKGSNGWVSDAFLLRVRDASMAQSAVRPAAEESLHHRIAELESEIVRLRDALADATARAVALAERNAELPAEATRPAAIGEAAQPSAGNAARPDQAPATTLPAASPLAPLEPIARPAVSPAEATSDDAGRVVPPEAVAEVRERLASWATAASRGDVNAYLEHYASAFLPADGSGRGVWEATRAARLSQPEAAFVEIGSDLRVEVTDAAHASTRFTQPPGPGLTAGRRLRTLEWVREDQRWRILRELSEPEAP